MQIPFLNIWRKIVSFFSASNLDLVVKPTSPTGKFVVRQPNGIASTDDIEIYKVGGAAVIDNKTGSLTIKNSAFANMYYDANLASHNFTGVASFNSGLYATSVNQGFSGDNAGTIGVGDITLVAGTGSLLAKNYYTKQSTLTYSATPALDFAGDGQKTITLTGDAAFTTSNKAANKSLTLRIIGDSSLRNISFPGTWHWLGGLAPATLAANKNAMLQITCFGTTDADVYATYAAEV